MWAPFMVANGEGGHSSLVNTEYLKWIHGFWKARLERCYGWVPVRNLDNKALAASMRSSRTRCSMRGFFCARYGSLF